jgi:hypothetical protein
VQEMLSSSSFTHYLYIIHFDIRFLLFFSFDWLSAIDTTPLHFLSAHLVVLVLAINETYCHKVKDINRLGPPTRITMISSA